MKLLVWLGATGALLAVLGVLALTVDFSPALPSEEMLLNRFAQHTACFEEIVSMAREETKALRIASTFVRLGYSLQDSVEQRRAQLSDERWDRYRTLFKCAEVPDGIDFSGSGADFGVYFYVGANGFAGSGMGVGYHWLETQPQQIVKSFRDRLPRDGYGTADVFRHIEGP